LTIRLLLRSAAAREPFAQLAAPVSPSSSPCRPSSIWRCRQPAAGESMTLPFISYGGSSLFAVALTMGFALALIRHRPKSPCTNSRCSAF